MGDDPYDFEIAIPAASSNVRSNSKHPSSIDSGDDASDDSGSLSNMSDISSGNDDNDSHRGVESKPAKSTSEFKTVTPSFGSALDRAKNFLSKYSSGVVGDSNGSNTPTRRRVSLDLDDDDDSFMGSSGGSTELVTNEKNAGPTISSAMSSKIQDSESLQASVNSESTSKRDETEPNRVAAPDDADEDRSCQNSDHASLSAQLLPMKGTATPSDHDESKSEVEDSIESFHSGTSDEQQENIPATTKPSITQQRSAYQEESADDYNESFQEESLSQSNVADNGHQGIQRSQVVPTFSSKKPEQSIASESEVYEEDAFEEDSAVATANFTSAMTSQLLHVANPNAEKAFDYSMDFSDDENDGHVPFQFQTPRPAINDQDQLEPTPEISTSRSLSGQSVSGEQSALFESNSFEREDSAIDIDDGVTTEQLAVEHPMSVTIEAPVAYSAPMSEQVPEGSLCPTSSADNSSVGNDNAQQAPSHRVVDMPQTKVTPIQKVNSPKARCRADDMTAAQAVPQRPRVTIIRAIELNEENRVEMKDASTQFTGNHAAIQADLIPEGMHNLFVSTPPASSSCNVEKANEVPPPDTESISCQSNEQPPPPPPVSQQLGSAMYNLEAFKLPLTTSTSLYKQQLLALQEQILQKKRETERIVRDRMTFQYSSLRGTERFIAARRTQKLELWEALMRVDPTLDERKAREVARLAKSAST